jgi:uncharacterized membrane protein
MAGNVQDLVREALISALQGGGSSQDGNKSSRSNGGLSGMKGIAAGAGAAALAPVALKGVGRLARGLGIEGLEDAVKSPGEALGGAASSLGDRLTSSVKDQVEGKVDDAGGPGGLLKEAAKSALPFGGGGGDSKGGGAAGVGEGRRMPVQQSMDIGLPIETVYNQFTQFEEWPNFMHRVTCATQEDDCTVSFSVKVWANTKEFTAQIEEQHPEERIKWRVSQGMDLTGVVSFHELGPRLTRVLVGFDVKPGGLIEKFARGAERVCRHRALVSQRDWPDAAASRLRGSRRLGDRFARRAGARPCSRSVGAPASERTSALRRSDSPGRRCPSSSGRRVESATELADAYGGEARSIGDTYSRSPCSNHVTRSA